MMTGLTSGRSEVVAKAPPVARRVASTVNHRPSARASPFPGVL
ncbi:unnamed protein product [Ectocarpus sp. 12 AP-2014]